jgi:hypothetical protein
MSTEGHCGRKNHRNIRWGCIEIFRIQKYHEEALKLCDSGPERTFCFAFYFAK